MTAEKLLNRLDRVKQTAPGKWIARCPAHDDHNPSLSIREFDDGRVLIHCFAGCGTDDVLAALGLTMGDLFPVPLRGTGRAGGFSRSHSTIPARDLLEVISEEVSIVALIGADMLAGKEVTADGWARLASAVSRIHRARDHFHVQ